MALSYPTTVNASFITKYLYPDGVSDLSVEENPLLSIIKKGRFVDNGLGLGYVIPVVYDAGPGESKTIATAITNAGAAQGGAFTVTHVGDWVVHELNGDVAAALAGGSKTALMQLKAWHELNFRQANARISKELFGNGSCQRGCLATTAGSTTLTLTLATKSDALLWNVGDIMTSLASAALYGTKDTGKGTITVIDESAGIITATTGDSWAPVAGDYFFKEGDIGAAWATRKGISGLRAWLCGDAIATYGTLFGVARAAAKSRTCGWYIDCSGLGSAKSCLLRFLQFLGSRGQHPDTVLCHPNFKAQLEEELEGQVSIQRIPAQRLGGEAIGFGFDAMFVNGVKVLADYSCAKTEIFGLKLNTWSLRSVNGDVPRIMNYTGADFMQAATADTFQVRYGYYANLACDRPDQNGFATVPAFLDL